MMINSGEASNFAYESDQGMDERQLLEWLGAQTQMRLASEQTVTDNDKVVAIPEWLLPKVEHTRPSPTPIEDHADLKEIKETACNQPWSLVEVEEDLTLKPELRELVSKGLHALSDERRLLLLILIGTKPEGTSVDDICDRYMQLADTDSAESRKLLQRQITRQIDTWLIGNGLAERFLSVKEDLTKTRLTEEGQKLLPLSGHLIDWAIRNGNVRQLLGRPAISGLSNEDTESSTCRQNLEQLADLLNEPNKRLRFNDLRTHGLSDQHLRNRLEQLIEGRWFICIPSPTQPEENYPAFVSREFTGVDNNPKTIEAAVKYYISKVHRTKPGVMTLHGLVFHGQYRTLNKKAGSNRDFASEVFQEYELLLSQNKIEELNSGTIRVNEFVISRVKLKAMRDLVSLVRGAEIGSEDYVSLGLRKILQHLATPSKIISQIILNAEAAENKVGRKKSKS